MILAGGCVLAAQGATEPTGDQTVTTVEGAAEQRIESLSPGDEQRVEAVDAAAEQQVTEGTRPEENRRARSAAKVAVGILSAVVSIAAMAAMLFLF